MAHLRGIFLWGICSILMFSLSDRAESREDEYKDRVRHYLVELPATEDASLKLLEEKIAAIAPILEKASLTGSDLEAVHEISYSLEAAVDGLRKYQKDDRQEALDVLDEAVQAMHYASEDHAEDETRKWFDVLSKAADQVASDF